MSVRDHVAGAGYPQQTKEQLKKKWEDLATSTKAKWAQKRKTGGGGIEWTPVDELVTEILGKDNPSLIFIPGGIDSGKNRSDRPPAATDNFENNERERQTTSSSLLLSPKEPASLSELSDTDEVNDCVNITIRQPARDEPSRGRKVTVEDVYERHLTEAHDAKMRTLRIKDQLIDMKLQYYRRKIVDA